MVNLYIGLRRYLYAFFLIFFATLSHAADPKVISMGGYPYTVVCSHATNLDFCADARVANAKETACRLWMTQLNSTYSYSFDSVVSGTPDYCMYSGRNPSNGAKVTTTQQLTTKSGLCPPQGDPPPVTVIFSRQGRWFPQELEDKRCFRNCLYGGGQNFSYKHYSFTNGIVTEFTALSGGLKSQEEFCDAKPEPVRNSQGEVTYDAGCQDNMFKVFCDFVEWFRTDSEMPDAPKVESESINLGYIDTGHIVVQGNAAEQCFEPTVFEMNFDWGGLETVKQEIKYDVFCTKIRSLGNIWRALYLIAACYVIFGGRK
ncbi:TPA: hypothetical protein U9I90_003700 [Acinetobacter baumannii]|nr:hypothetical protein [Acinetobacter baumannii]